MSLQFELVLPCYNEAKSIQTIVSRAIEAARESGLTAGNFQLVLVENGSRDDSRVVMEKLKADADKGPWFRIVPIDVNRGYGVGVHAGLQSTTAPIIGWSHADQQCDPRDAFKAFLLLRGSANKKKLIKGIRTGRSAKEIFVSRVFDFFALILLKQRHFEINAQPKVFSRQFLNLLTNPPTDFAYDIYVLYTAKKNGYDFQTIDVNFPARIHGLSNWAFSLKSRAKAILGMIQYMSRLGKSG